MEDKAETVDQPERLVCSLAEVAQSPGGTRTLKREINLGRLKVFKIGRQWRVVSLSYRHISNVTKLR